MSSSRVVASTLQKASGKQVSAERNFRRLLHSTTGGATSNLFLSSVLDRRHRDNQRNETVYHRALPRYVAPSAFPYLPPVRSFSTTEEQRETMRRRMLERASHMRDSARERATHMRKSARASYEDFREHPRESMEKGAKSFSGMLRKYGPVFIGTYGAVYLTTLGSLFACVQSGLLDPTYLFGLFGHVDAGETKNTVDLVVDWMKNHSITEPYAPFMERNPYLANLAVAWIAVKFTEPVRAAASLALTPRVARALGYNTTPTEQDPTEQDADASATKPTMTESSDNTAAAEKKA